MILFEVFVSVNNILHPSAGNQAMTEAQVHSQNP